jgi:hypothetical protein
MTEQKFGSKEFTEEIRNFVNELGLELSDRGENELQIFFDSFSNISLRIEVTDESELKFSLFIKTSSWVFDGERTDLHDVISVVFSVYLKVTLGDISFVLLDLPHPVCPSFDENEIYARYIIPYQGNPSYNDISRVNLESTKSFILCTTMWKHFFWLAVGCPCRDCVEESGVPFTYDMNVPEEWVEKIWRATGKPSIYNCCSRNHPNWTYYRDFEKTLSVVYSPVLAYSYKCLIEHNLHNFRVLQGVEADLHFNDNLRNTISFKNKEFIRNLLRELGDGDCDEPKLFPLDNILFGVGEQHIVIFDVIGDDVSFYNEKKEIRKRFENEAKYLFPVSKFKWAEKVNPDRFESLIKLLLERELEVKWVRKVSPTNQPDEGRDLIMEKYVPITTDESQSPFVIRKIIVQCKAFNRSVGKGDVKDIRDTIECHNYDGYFLAVSNQITTPLTKNLERLKEKGFDINWWNRDDIEARLCTHQDLIKLFSELIEPIA